MPLQKLQLRPGVNRESTSYANEGGYYASNKIRFRSGMPEKVGGWAKDTGTNLSTLQPTTGTLWGVCRALWNWLNLTGYNLLALGTNLKYYIQNGVNGFYYDVTPLRNTTTAGEATFAAATGSTTITVTDAGHGAQTGDFVTFSGAVSLGGVITAAILNAEFQITYLSSNQYTITSSVAANASDSGNGGGSVIAAYQITTGNPVYTQNVGWGAGTWGGLIVGTATTAVSGGTLSAANTTVTVPTLAQQAQHLQAALAESVVRVQARLLHIQTVQQLFNPPHLLVGVLRLLPVKVLDNSFAHGASQPLART